MRDPESLYAWAQERQLQLHQEADRRRLLNGTPLSSLLPWIRLPFIARRRA